jgi:FkbM family methyltransferase
MPQNARPASCEKSTAWKDLALAFSKSLRLLLTGKLFREPSTLSRALKKGRWLLIKHLSIDEVVLPLIGDMKLCVSTADNIIACDVYVDGQFGYGQFEIAIEHLRKARYFSPERTVFVDIGANIGTHTLYALRTGIFARVISVEPEPRNFELLTQNLRINGFATTDARNVGLSDRTGESLLELSCDNLGDHRIARTNMPQSPATFTGPRVRLLDFGTLTKELNLEREAKILFWIDTQGHEFEVLNGIEPPFLRKNAFVVEFWPSLLRENGTLERFLEMVRREAVAYLVLQDPAVVHSLEELQLFSEDLLTREHPADQVDILFLGRQAIP